MTGTPPPPPPPTTAPDRRGTPARGPGGSPWLLVGLVVGSVAVLGVAVLIVVRGHGSTTTPPTTARPATTRPVATTTPPGGTATTAPVATTAPSSVSTLPLVRTGATVVATSSGSVRPART